MKLKLKHLTVYLPYNIKAIHKNYKDEKGFLYYPLDLTERFYSMPTAILINFKPILKPLSQITKEINQNGKTINIDLISFKLLGGRFLSEVLKEGKLIDELPHGLVSVLYEYHFDVFGLIENGLAIDINTLNN